MNFRAIQQSHARLYPGQAANKNLPLAARPYLRHHRYKGAKMPVFGQLRPICSLGPEATHKGGSKIRPTRSRTDDRSAG
jgi:hypothetical protein